MARRRHAWGAAVCAVVAVAGCGGDDRGDPPEPHPLVADIPAALAAFTALDTGTELFQVSSTPEHVELIQRVEADAVGYTYADGVLSPAEPLGRAEGFTFTADDVTFDPRRVLAGVVDELDDPTITRFEVLGGPDGAIYSAFVLSDSGGVLQIDLAADGTVRGAAPVD